MDTKMLIRYYDIRKEIGDIYHKITIIDKISKEYDGLFTKKESIEALTRLKNYYIDLNNRMKDLEQEKKEMKKTLRSTCNHKLVRLNYEQKICMICGNFADDKPYDYLVTDRDKVDEVFDLFLDALYNNQDLDEVLDNYIFENEGMKKLRR